jgi:hypothetical protein
MPSRETQISPQWLAGFFDGEGGVNFTQAGSPRQLVYRLYIVNTNEKVLRAIQNSYGGFLAVREYKNRPNCKPWHALVWTTRRARLLLDIIEPYVILKRPQVELIREWENWRPIGATRVKTQESQERELEFVNRMHELNRRGRAHAEQSCVVEVQERKAAFGE